MRALILLAFLVGCSSIKSLEDEYFACTKSGADCSELQKELDDRHNRIALSKQRKQKRTERRCKMHRCYKWVNGELQPQ